MNPNSLFARNNRKQPTNPHARKLDVEADMTPVAEFLQQTAGLSREQTAKARRSSGSRGGAEAAGTCHALGVACCRALRHLPPPSEPSPAAASPPRRPARPQAISAHPPLLCYSVPDRLAPFFVFLTSELGLSAAEAAAVVRRAPSFAPPCPAQHTRCPATAAGPASPAGGRPPRSRLCRSCRPRRRRWSGGPRFWGWRWMGCAAWWASSRRAGPPGRRWLSCWPRRCELEERCTSGRGSGSATCKPLSPALSSCLLDIASWQCIHRDHSIYAHH